MKATGIVRKIDDLGRIVIPKEIRKTLHIREGDPLEIFIEQKGDIILRKYAPMGDMIDMSSKYIDTLSEMTEFIACITDSETVIAISKNYKNEYLGKSISDEIIELMKERKKLSTIEDKKVPILLNEKSDKYVSQIIVPIIANTDVIGSVILFSINKKQITDVEIKLVESAAKFLSKQFE